MFNTAQIILIETLIEYFNLKSIDDVFWFDAYA